MGANGKQGWCLFGLLIGFPSMVGGLAVISEGHSGLLLPALGTLAGVVLMVISCVGLYRIKPLEHAGMTGPQAAAPSADVKPKSAVR